MVEPPEVVQVGVAPILPAVVCNQSAKAADEEPAPVPGGPPTLSRLSLNVPVPVGHVVITGLPALPDSNARNPTTMQLSTVGVKLVGIIRLVPAALLASTENESIGSDPSTPE